MVRKVRLNEFWAAGLRASKTHWTGSSVQPTTVSDAEDIGASKDNPRQATRPYHRFSSPGCYATMTWTSWPRWSEYATPDCASC
jgi:hypothetical protein